MLSTRRCSVILVGTVALLVGLVAPTESAYAYPQDPNNCNDRTLHWEFNDDDVTWSNTKKNWARAAINKLDDELSYDGTKLITVTEDGGIDVRLKDKPVGSYGSSECFAGASIWVNSNYNTDDFYWKVTRHEMFHLAGAEHAGRSDSMNSDNIPTMASCVPVSDFRTVNALSQDDRAYMNWLHNSLSYRQLHANIGFEQGKSYWGSKSGSISTYSTGGATGPGHVGLWATSTEWSSYIFQTVRLWTGDDNGSYRVKINAKKPVGSYTTRAMGRIYRRTMTESGDNSCSYADGLKNPNNLSVSSGYVYMTGTSMTTLSTSWTALTSSWSNPSNTDGLQLQVRAYGRSLTSTGGTGSVRFDNVRGEGTSS